MSKAARPIRRALVSHRNARTTFQGRLLIVERHRAGWAQAHIAKAMGISEPPRGLRTSRRGSPRACPDRRATACDSEG